jgi:hypothetical protein
VKHTASVDMAGIGEHLARAKEVRVFQTTPFNAQFSHAVLDAINYALDRGAHVIHYSCVEGHDKTPWFDEVAAKARAAGVVLVSREEANEAFRGDPDLTTDVSKLVEQAFRRGGADVSNALREYRNTIEEAREKHHSALAWASLRLKLTSALAAGVLVTLLLVFGKAEMEAQRENTQRRRQKRPPRQSQERPPRQTQERPPRQTQERPQRAPEEFCQHAQCARGQTIHACYRRRALALHPDKHPGDVEGATKRFQALANIYDAAKKISEAHVC